MPSVLVLNGPNLNMLGTREPEKYGKQTLQQIEDELRQQAQTLQLDIELLQSNSETILVERIHQCAKDSTDFLIINAAALTHTSIALRDAISAVNVPFIELHISNVYRREPFRQNSYLSDIAQGVITGLGAHGYQLALLAAHHFLTQSSSPTK